MFSKEELKKEKIENVLSEDNSNVQIDDIKEELLDDNNKKARKEKKEKDNKNEKEIRDELKSSINDSGIEEIVLLKQSLEEKDEIIENLKNEIDNYKDSLMRMKADFDNFRKRLNKEKDDFIKYYIIKIIEDFLPIIDNFQRAINSFNGEKDDPFFQGILMIEKSIEELLSKKYNCVSFGDPGDLFDPTLHEAISIIEDENVNGFLIKEVYQKGYKMEDKIIRTAKVLVVKEKKKEQKKS
ncbi:MAG: nucleotide exchange factor GrpE [Spirochaetes bacterium]|nr:nucleotide exchange factor GrpE [Spirochaetota bacterium]